jgi:hypothetical protein
VLLTDGLDVLEPESSSILTLYPVFLVNVQVVLCVEALFQTSPPLGEVIVMNVGVLNC